MDKRREKIEILRKYLPKMNTGFIYHIGDEVPSRKIDNATKKFANSIDKESVIGFYDTTILESGKTGYLFTDTKLYYFPLLEKRGKLWYDGIESVKLVDSGNKNDKYNVKISLYNDKDIIVSDSMINKLALYDFLREIVKLENSSSDMIEKVIGRSEKNMGGALAGGVATAAYGQVNKLYDEEKFSARQGHGFSAERANHMYDKLTGKKAKIVGDDNIKNGADRMVDGVMIQSKYCKSGRACINECFDKEGRFRYLVDNKPMQIEVPSDKFDSAVHAMEEKIREGKIPGVSDPSEAKNIVRQGHFTYEQAKNIAKAGTIESLTYDTVNGVITASSAFGVTMAITLAINIWNGEDFNKSLKMATATGLKVGGTAFITSVIASQASKAGLNSALVGSTEAIVAIMGPKASAVIVNAFRSGSNIYGAAAMKSAAKLLRGNAITASVTVVVLSSFDIADLFTGRISGSQLFKNLTNTASTVAGGTGGWVGGAALGSAILPGIGTVVGGIVGSVVAGAAANKVSDSILGNFVEDDANEMVSIIQKEFETLAQDYLLNHKEAEKSIDVLRTKLDGNLLKEMYASKNRKEFANNLLVPIIEDVVSKRKRISAVSDKDMVACLKEVLENIGDEQTENESDNIR